MKFRLCLAALLAVFSIPVSSLRAQTAAAPAPATAPDAEADLGVLLNRVKAKLESGQGTEADLKEELQRFDDLMAQHAKEQTDAAAMIGVMKARLYLEVFENTAKGIEILKQVKADFPQTKVAQQIDGFVAGLEKQLAAEQVTAVGQTFATFSEKDLDGQPLDLASYRGKVVLVDFWATWCGPCVHELPNVIAAYEKYHAQGFEIVGVSLDQDREALTSFLKEHHMTWQQYFDGKGWENKLAQAYSIQAIPAAFLLDANGKIVAKGLRGDALAAKIGELLGAK